MSRIYRLTWGPVNGKMETEDFTHDAKAYAKASNLCQAAKILRFYDIEIKVEPIELES